MIDRVVAGSHAARPPQWRLILTAVLTTGSAFVLAAIVFAAIVGPPGMDMLAALLPQPGPAFLTAVFLLLAALLTYLGFYRRLNPPLRWLLAIGLGAGFAAVLYVWPDEAPLDAAVLATAIFTVFIVATAACFAPKQQATTSVASGKEKSHG